MVEEIARLLLAPACVVAVSLAGRRWGSNVAGILGGLPVVAGPILLILTLEHGRDFGDEAAAGCLLGLTALTAFVVTYGRRAPHSGPLPTLLLGWTSFLAAAGALALLDSSLAIAAAMAAIAFLAGLATLPAPREPIGGTTELPWWDLPARGSAALALVVALTVLSSALGPTLSGLLSPFPIVTSVLAVFVHARSGASSARVLLRGFLIGYWAFAAFCLVLALALPAMAVASAFALAMTVALAVQGVAVIARLAHRRIDPRVTRPSPPGA